MRFLLLPKWVRRVVTVPMMLLLFIWVLGLLPLWLIVAAFVSRFVPGRWRPLRLAWFATLYLALEVILLVALAGLWVASGCGRRLHTDRSLDRHYRLMGWFVGRVIASARITFALEVVPQSDISATLDPTRPVLVLCRHAGAGDSFLLIDGIINGTQHRRPRIVLKDVLQLDPAIDIMLNRVGASFVPSAGKAGDAVVAEIVRLAETAGPRDAIAIFPEGGNFTPARRLKAIDKLNRIGRPDLAQRAESLDHMLPPKPLGVTAAIAAAPTATVLFVGHAGLEQLSSLRDIWRNIPMQQPVLTRFWLDNPVDVPAPQHQEAWLYDRWAEIDRWVDTSLAEHAAAVAAEASVAAPLAATWKQRRRASASLGSVFGSLLLWWESLRPTMLPRSWLVQGAVGAICAAAGFGFGGLVQRSARRVVGVFGRRWPVHRREPAITALLVLGTASVLIGPWRWLHWQQGQRALVGMDPVGWRSIPPMLMVTALLFWLFVVGGRLIKHLVARLDRTAQRHLPISWARWAVAALLLTTSAIGLRFLVKGFADWADQNFGAFDHTTAEGLMPPTDPLFSGSPPSVVDWNDLGFEGRNFVARAPSAEMINSFYNATVAVTPIRVYAGLQSADTVEQRVALAIEELERTGAFERKVLVVATPTGTGWVDPDAARTIEYMYQGDTAIVSVQYGYLPSWIAFLLDTASPPVLGRALFDAVHAKWATLPADTRPKLVVFGQSLGSLGAEEPFNATGSTNNSNDTAFLNDSIRLMTAQSDAALFTGPTRSNPIFGAIVESRDPSSPSWIPTVAGEPHLRVANRIEDLVDPDPTWVTPRVLYVHHPSDAIGTWQWSNLWSNPGWSANPPAYDLPKAARWIPFVTFAQESFDLMAGFSASPGFGHDYRTDFVHAWAALLPPAGWTNDDSNELLAHLNLVRGG